MKVEDIRNICNLGTGTMGFGTALTFAKAGYNVRMFGRSAASLERAFRNIQAALATYRENDLVRDADIPGIMGRIRGVSSLEEAAVDADFVIESVAEDLAVKRDVFARMDELCPAHTIFATNTSGLSPTAIAEGIGRKDKFVVAHFWNPPHLLPLVEIVPGKHTHPEVVALTKRLMEMINKKPIVLDQEAPGFIGNRLQFALLREAMHIVESGIASKEAVDTAVKYSIGRRLGVTGPLESADLGGLDVFLNISSYLMPELSDRHDVPRIMRERVERGAFGAKTRTGLYDWTPERVSAINKMRENTLIGWLQKDKEMVF